MRVIDATPPEGAEPITVPEMHAAPEAAPAESEAPAERAAQPETRKHKRPKAEAPEPPPPDPVVARRERALRSLRRPFVAEQRITMRSQDSERASRATFFVFPGAGYRLHVKGPLSVTLLDVSVRCGRYRYSVPLKLKRFEGPLPEAANAVGHFPVEALFALFDPDVRGSWKKETFIADHGNLVAVLHPTLDAFAFWRIKDAYGRPINVRIESFAEDTFGFLLPKRMVLELPDGRTVILDAEQFLEQVPAISSAIAEITC